MKKLTIYFDMDGVLANFDKDVKKMSHLDEVPWINIPKFFRNLQPIGNPNKTIQLLQDLGYKVFILTKVEQRDKMDRVEDKVNWCKEHLPCIKMENIICVPGHLSKVDYIKSEMENSVLIDDYKGNLKEWKDLGGIAIKFGNKWKKEREYFQIVEDIFNSVSLIESLNNSR